MSSACRPCGKWVQEDSSWARSSRRQPAASCPGVCESTPVGSGTPDQTSMHSVLHSFACRPGGTVVTSIDHVPLPQAGPAHRAATGWWPDRQIRGPDWPIQAYLRAKKKRRCRKPPKRLVVPGKGGAGVAYFCQQRASNV